jgi:hypothetical protein
MHQFSVGEVVTWSSDRYVRSAAPGDYRIVALMPDRDGDHMYKIKSPREEYERVVQQDVLVKSAGWLPDEYRKPAARRKSITLPTLQS